MGDLKALGNLRSKQQRHDTNLLRIATIAAAGEAFVIGADTFTCVASAPAAGQFVPGADAAASITNIAAVINANNTQDLTAIALAGVGVLVVSDRAGARGLACTETLAGTNNAWSAARMYGGTGIDEEGNLRAFDVIAITPTAVEVAVGRAAVRLGFVPSAWFIQVRDSSGVSKAWDGAAALDSGDTRVLLLNNAGSTDWAATDEIVILAVE